jgi:hypothetical protein
MIMASDKNRGYLQLKVLIDSFDNNLMFRMDKSGFKILKEKEHSLISV